MSDGRQPPGTNQISLAISEIENILRATGALSGPIPHEAESVIMYQLGHFFYMGQMSARAILDEMRIEIMQLHAKVDMACIDIKELTVENQALRRELENLRERR